MPRRKPQPARATARDPERTKRRILAAALHEFAKHGFAGGRVDTIARRAGTNKRMLYHYFTDKDGLFCAVLRHKISERTRSVQAAAAGRESELAPWFEQNCRDTDWVRLLAWESLQPARGKIMDGAERRRYALGAIRRIRDRQAAGGLIKGVEPQFLQLTLAALTMFPIAMPQMTRLITGQSPQDPRFQRGYIRYLETIARRFRPSGGV
jgi:AcrR family transcriptional regulator